MNKTDDQENIFRPAIKAMILAAGFGTRLKPWTDNHPKALAVVNGKTLLQRNIEYLQQYGIREVVVNVHHFAEQIIDAVNENNGWGSKIIVSNEKEEPLETGGGLLHATELLQHSQAIVLMNVDILTDLDLGKMLDFHFTQKPLATLATTNRTSSRYFLFDKNNQLCGWRNTKTGEEKSALPLSGNEVAKAFSGIHVIDPAIFSRLTQAGKFSIVDTYLELMKTNTILSFDHSDSQLIDVGKPESLVKAAEMFK